MGQRFGYLIVHQSGEFVTFSVFGVSLQSLTSIKTRFLSPKIFIQWIFLSFSLDSWNIRLICFSEKICFLGLWGIVISSLLNYLLTISLYHLHSLSVYPLIFLCLLVVLLIEYSTNISASLLSWHECRVDKIALGIWIYLCKYQVISSLSFLHRATFSREIFWLHFFQESDIFKKSDDFSPCSHWPRFFAIDKSWQNSYYHMNVYWITSSVFFSRLLIVEWSSKFILDSSHTSNMDSIRDSFSLLFVCIFINLTHRNIYQLWFLLALI